MTPAKFIVALPALLLTALLFLSAARAAPPMTNEEVERRVLAITDDLRCPTCQGLSVKDSEAGFSQQIRDKVRLMVIEGQSDEDIKAYFVARYGEWILRAPKKEGFGLVLWLLPGLAIVAAGGAIFWRMHRRAKAQAAVPASPLAGLTPAQRERLERDLRRFQEED
jgi:cytochrome c-type biogenesis protein CcmH